jgi:hypothetical protein
VVFFGLEERQGARLRKPMLCANIHDARRLHARMRKKPKTL